MIVQVRPDGVSVTEADDLRSLSVASDLGPADISTTLSACGFGQFVDAETILLDVSRLHEAAQAASSDPAWVDHWVKMIIYAEKQGWLLADGTMLRAHLQ